MKDSSSDFVLHTVYILQASKLISRETKKIRGFILQRLVKRCRKLRGEKEGGEGEEGAQGVKAAVQEETGAVKKVLEEIQAVKVCSRREP